MSARTTVSAALLMIGTVFGCADLPTHRQVESVQVLDQGWSEAQRQWFYHASQGTKLMPYRWFLALEQPELSLFGAGRFAAPEYLVRFGFIQDPKSADNPDGLPVGFARDEFGQKEGTSERETVVGLTCAACHTAQVEHAGRGIRIDGGPATIDTGAFQEQMGRALFLTFESEPRFARFAGRVLGTSDAPDTPEARAQLRRRLEVALDTGRTEVSQARRRALYPVDEGPGRLDALGRGGNFVFGTLQQDPRNFVVADAPVSFPALWDAPWFEWVQYNGAIRQPMGRNVAEAMGVRSVAKLFGPPENLYRSSVRIKALHEMEEQLAGPAPGRGLRPPAWPEEILGPISRGAAERGKEHYQRLCSGCHEGTWTPATGEHARAEPARRYLRLRMFPIEDIGTDPKAAMNFVQRRAYPEAAATTQITAAEGLESVTTKVIQRWYGDNNVSTETRREMDSYRANDWRALPQYRARPLAGIWATGPYLHNGSVPNLYQLLLPAERRDVVFFTGSRQFDPKNVGFVTAPFRGGFRFDTSLPGNFNRGHEFRSGPLGSGIVGPELTDQQRWELIEYLKTL